MNWKIVETKHHNKVGLESDFHTIDEYLSSFDLRSWSTILERVLEDEQLNLTEYEDIIYPACLDEGDIAAGILIPEDSVMYRLLIDSNARYLIKKRDLESAILALADRLVQVHEKDPELFPGWADEMRESIAKLKQKIAKYPA